MKKILNCFMAAALLVACGSDGRIVEPKGGDAHMVLMEQEHDFGNVSDKEGTVEHEFVIANDGGKAFVLLSAKPHCDCTSVDFKPERVEPGYGTTVKVTLDVKSLSPGEFMRQVDLTPSCTHDPASTTITLKGVKL